MTPPPSPIPPRGTRPTPAARSVVVVVLLLLLLLLVARSGSVVAASVPYSGPRPCPSDPSVSGYDNTTTLTYDMLSILVDVAGGGSDRSESYEFVLCPRTSFDMGSDLGRLDGPDMLPVIPLLDGSIFLCGPHGRSDDECVLRGGFHHVLFEDDIAVGNVIFSGITFEGSESISVVAWGHPNSEVAFVDCEWKNNVGGLSLVDLYWHRDLTFGPEPEGRRGLLTDELRVSYDVGDVTMLPSRWAGGPPVVVDGAIAAVDRRMRSEESYPAMYSVFVGCRFTDNEADVALIFNQGGRLELVGCTLESNRAAVVLANAMGAVLSMRGGNYFLGNRDVFGPVFLDSTSYLSRNEDTYGEYNTAITLTGDPNPEDYCDAIFIERGGGDCLSGGPGGCDGTCCDFGDTSCAAYADPAFFRRGGGGGVCDAGCVLLAMAVPASVLAAAGVGIWYVRRWRLQSPPGGGGTRERYEEEDDTVAESVAEEDDTETSEGGRGVS